MTTVDLNAVKERIVEILKNDTTNLYSATPSDKTKFRKIEAGSPTPKAVNEPPLPRMWVTSDSTVAIVKPLAVVSSNISQGEEFDLRIKIVMVVEAKDGIKGEEDLDDFTKAVIEKLQANYDLRTPGGAENTRVAEKSELKQIMDLPAQYKGDRVLGRSLHYSITVRA